jgi:hypothetical protein
MSFTAPRSTDAGSRSAYHPAVVQATSGRSMLVRLASGDDRLLPVPEAPVPTLVGATVLIRDDHDWVIATELPAAEEGVAVHPTTAGPVEATVGDDVPWWIDLRAGRGPGASDVGPRPARDEPSAPQGAPRSRPGVDARILPFTRRG